MLYQNLLLHIDSRSPLMMQLDITISEFNCKYRFGKDSVNKLGMGLEQHQERLSRPYQLSSPRIRICVVLRTISCGCRIRLQYSM